MNWGLRVGYVSRGIEREIGQLVSSRYDYFLVFGGMLGVLDLIPNGADAMLYLDFLIY